MILISFLTVEFYCLLLFVICSRLFLKFIMDQDLHIVNNKKDFRFEIAFPNGEYAFVQYRWLKGSMVLMRTLVPADMRGKGIGAKLVKYVLDYARSTNLKIVVYCAFVAKYIENHPEYNELVIK